MATSDPNYEDAESKINITEIKDDTHKSSKKKLVYLAHIMINAVESFHGEKFKLSNDLTIVKIDHNKLK